MRLLSLAYVSSARSLLSQKELVDVLETARKNNSNRDVTGILLYKDGNFMQVLEGPELSVRQLFSTISQDSRHKDVTVLLEEETCQREFAEWSMAFRLLDAPEVQSLPGFSDYLNVSFFEPELVKSPTRIGKMLRFFRSSL